jgi:hypothetical protein
MFIKKDNKNILGSIFTHNTKFIRGTYSGVINSGTNYVKEGIYAALYYFSILWAKDYNVSNLHLGTCKSFLNEGLLQYKRKWGGTVKNPFKEIQNNQQHIYGFKILNLKNGLKDFLLNNPFICLDKKNNLNATYITDNADKLTSEEVRHFERIYKLPNINELIISTPENFTINHFDTTYKI